MREGKRGREVERGYETLRARRKEGSLVKGRRTGTTQRTDLGSTLTFEVLPSPAPSVNIGVVNLVTDRLPSRGHRLLDSVIHSPVLLSPTPPLVLPLELRPQRPNLL